MRASVGGRAADGRATAWLSLASDARQVAPPSAARPRLTEGRHRARSRRRAVRSAPVRQDYDVIVVGGGVMGTSAASWLASRGRDMLLLERFEHRPRARQLGWTDAHLPAHVRRSRSTSGWRGGRSTNGGRSRTRPASRSCSPRRSRHRARPGDRRPRRSTPPARRSSTSRPRPSPSGGRRCGSRRGTEVFVQEDGGVAMAERTVRAQARVASPAGAHDPRGDARRADRGDRHRRERASPPGETSALRSWCDRRSVGGTPAARRGYRPAARASFEQVTLLRARRARAAADGDRLGRRPAAHAVHGSRTPRRPGTFKIALHMSGPAVDADERSFDPDPVRVGRSLEYAAGLGSRRIAPRAATTPACTRTRPTRTSSSIAADPS